MKHVIAGLVPAIHNGKRQMNEKYFYVYMMANKPYGTIYKGVTSNLVTRVAQHKEGTFKGFTEKYDIKLLVWYKECGGAEEALKFEKRLRKYPRQWKVNLINEMNPAWKDLYETILPSYGLPGQAG